jgi:hypothetical protein
MAEIVAAALTSHAPLVTGKPEIARPEQCERLHAGFLPPGRESLSDPARVPDALYGVMPGNLAS